MASIIRIKRSGVQGNPTTLAQGELAYSYFNGDGGDRLYIGTGVETGGDAVNHTVIGGAYYVSLLGGEGDAPFGVATPNTALILDSDGKVDTLSAGGVTFLNSQLTTAGDLTLSLGGDLSLSGSRITNLAEPIDSADATTKFYVDSRITDLAPDLRIAGDTGSASVYLKTETLSILGGDGLQVSVDSDTNSISVNYVPTGVTSGTYGSQTQIPTFTVDSDGRLTQAGVVDVATQLTINGDSISLLDSDVTFDASDNLLVEYDSLTNTINYALNAEVSNLTSLEVGNLRLVGNTLYSTDSSNTLYIDPAPTDSDGGTLVVRGNLVVQGTQTIINSTVMSVNDLTLTLADEATTPAEADGAGIFIAGADASIVYNAANDVIDINKGLNILAPFSINGTAIEQVIDSEVANLLTAGVGIDLAYFDSDNELVISAEYASTVSAGIASFDSAQFLVSAAGATTIYQLDGGTY